MITEITYNWHQFSDGHESGEDCEIAIVGSIFRGGKLRVTEIKEVDKTYHVIFEDNSILIVFNPNTVNKNSL
jgi:hypothetical protein